MCHGLDLTVIQKEGSLHQLLAVTGRAGTCDRNTLRQLFADLFEGADCRLHRRAVVITIERIEQTSVLIHQSHLGGGGAGIDAQEAFALIVFDLGGTDAVTVMAGGKIVVFLLVFKERFHTFHFKFHMNIAV